MENKLLKIGHVVALIDPQASYGGPVSVAMSLVNALNELGHDAEVWAGGQEYPLGAQIINNAPVKLFKTFWLTRRLSFSGLISPGMIASVFRKRQSKDYWHLHLSRDLSTLLIALLLKWTKNTYVVQTHGMISPRSGLIYRLVDALLVRPALSGAAKVFYLTDDELAKLTLIFGHSGCLSRLPNGVAVTLSRGKKFEERLSVVFLGRLHKVKNPLLVCEAAAKSQNDNIKFKVFGPDGGEKTKLLEFQSRRNLTNLAIEEPLAYGESTNLFLESLVLLLPSSGDVFPMAVLEALAAGLPVIVSPHVGLAKKISEYGAGIVASLSAVAINDAIIEITSNKETWKKYSEAARNLASLEYNIVNIAVQSIPNLGNA